MKAKHILVSGRVQGVGFRNFTLKCAVELGVYGAVRNLDDGSVEVVAKASSHILEAFIEKLREGPSRSKVETIKTTDLETEKVDFLDFVIQI